MKRALVLSGGGAKGAFQVGVISALSEHGIRFGFVSGVSVGALNAVMVAQDRTDDLQDVWLAIRGAKDIFKKRILGVISPFFGFSSLYHPKPLQKLIRLHLDHARLLKTGIQLRVGMVDLATGAYKVADQGHPFLHDCVLASTAIPLAFPPVNIGSNPDRLVDGGIRNVAPLAEAIEWGAEEIHVVLCNPLDLAREDKNYDNALNVVLRSVDIMVHEIIKNDVEICLLKNRLSETYRNIRVHLYAPETHLYGTLDFSPPAIRKAIDHGKQIAEKSGVIP